MRAIPTTLRSCLTLLVLALGLAAGAGCGPKDQRAGTPAGGAGGGAEDVLPCFADPGPIALTVNGIPIPEATLTRFAAFYRDADPAVSAEWAKSLALERAVIPTAVMYAEARSQRGGGGPSGLAAVTLATRAAKARIDAKEDFSAVARALSGWPSVDKDGGVIEAFPRVGNVIAPVAAAAFAIDHGDCATPVVSSFGVHLIRVLSAVDGASKAEDKRKVAHILIPFDGAALKDLARFGQHVRDLSGAAKIEIRMESWRQSVPMIYR